MLTVRAEGVARTGTKAVNPAAACDFVSRTVWHAGRFFAVAVLAGEASSHQWPQAEERRAIRTSCSRRETSSQAIRERKTTNNWMAHLRPAWRSRYGPLIPDWPSAYAARHHPRLAGSASSTFQLDAGLTKPAGPLAGSRLQHQVSASLSIFCL
ncbi:hypothetical protein N658DRAFT_73779 [Parathielavia hyrcaniae]|uniref:Uncharacterized protein n=1 Tax=Parathielavia hyrcaniae TaxID=113614 RepID=A0AAN6PSJ9_9PEZI|nr:hypothetical protein N658DRAFT_73779 [Parathielavia hyrcaniae]